MAQHRPWRAREKEALSATTALVVVSLVMALWPQLDVAVSRLFFDASSGHFVGTRFAGVMAMYHAVPWFGRTAGTLGLAVALLAWQQPRWGMPRRWWRRSMVLSLLMLLAVGGLVNGALKEHWGRARPTHVQTFGGDKPFTAAWSPSAACATNCSFVSGHAATGFAVMALGALGTAAARRRWWRVGMASGLVFGAGRVAQGGHFLSDVLIAGLLVWVTCCALRWLWLHSLLWRRARAGHRRRPKPIRPSALSPTEN